MTILQKTKIKKGSKMKSNNVVDKMVLKVESSVLGAAYALTTKNEKELKRNKLRLENSLDCFSFLEGSGEVKVNWLELYKTRVWNTLFKVDKVLGV